MRDQQSGKTLRSAQRLGCPDHVGLIMNPLEVIDQNILEFAHAPGNDEFLIRTRSYSTPFRGTLFGKSTVSEVWQELQHRSARVLVLGANPNNSDESHPQRCRRFRSLQEHINTCIFGEVYWDVHGRPQAGWTAADEDRWKMFLLEPLLAAGVQSESVAFANLLPWGSSPDLKSLLAALNHDQAERATAFANDMLAQLLGLLRPALVVAPRSIGAQLQATELGRQQLTSKATSFSYASGKGTSPLNYYVGCVHDVRLLQLPHPASIRATHAGRAQLAEHLRGLFAGLLT